MMSALLTLFLGIVQEDLPPSPVIAGPEGARAFSELETYYRDKAKPPPLPAALQDLNSEDAERRRSAGRYVLALLSQLFADESNGRGEWRETGWWGGGSESPTRDFRKEVARALADSAKTDEALDAVVWLLTDERIAEHQVSGLEALKRIPGPRADGLLAGVLREPHPNGSVLTGAIEEAGRRKLAQAAPEITALASHHRATVRAAAQTAAAALGIPPPASKTAFLPSIDRMLRTFAGQILTPIPEDAAWGRFVITRPPYREGDDPRLEEFSGWKLSEREGIVRMLTVHGADREAPASQVRMTARTLADEARDLLRLREAATNGDRDAQRQISRQFDPPFISTPEALVAAWSYRRGDLKTASELLFPRLESAKDDRWVLWAVRDLLGHLYHRPMLDHFSEERDYPATLRLAAHLSKDLFQGYEYQPRAKELLRQLPQRTEDFKTLTLPTAEEWAVQRANLSRGDQVHFLARRLRLLNCFQHRQPGNVSYTDPQFPKPMSELREVENYRTLPQVINPYVELMKMRLAIAELPTLVPYLADDRFMPTYSFWRGFHPSRTLHQVNWAVEKIVNESALQDLADLDTYARLHGAGKRQHLDRIVRWCRDHSETPRADLLMNVIRTAKEWPEITRRAAEAFASEVPGALDAVVKRIAEFPDQRDSLPELCHATHVKGALPLARSWLKDSAKETRLYAALILLRGEPGDRRDGLAELEELLRKEAPDLLPQAIDDLLAARTPETDALALLCLRTRIGEPEWYLHRDLFRRLFLRGMKECRDYLLANLASEDALHRGYVVGDEMAWLLNEWSPSLQYPAKAAPEVRRQHRIRMGTWVREQFARIEKGEPPQMNAELRPFHQRPWMFEVR